MTATAKQTRDRLLIEVFLAEKGIDSRDGDFHPIDPGEYMDWWYSKHQQFTAEFGIKDRALTDSEHRDKVAWIIGGGEAA